MSFRLEAVSASFEGVVSEGPFKGGTAHANGRTTTSAAELGAQCVTSGVTSYTATIDQFTIGDR
ncbi:hypothetical protein ABZX62_26980 [Streptomyces flavidovirens]|uniref:hypothetical protein n=1 Tax=Streptomyces flavidovirens TaxID=67298 RepID=UPI0033AB5CD4